MPVLNHHFRTADDGRLVPRKLSVSDAVIIGNDLQARRAILTERFPDALRQHGAALLDAVAEATHALDAAVTARDQAPPPPLAEIPHPIRPFGDEDQLRSLAYVNRLEGTEVSTLKAFLNLKLRATGGVGEAAQRLHAAWFDEGRLFLRLKGRDQWIAVRTRWATLPETQQQDVATLRLNDDVERIQTINAWHGQLLGITQAPTITEPEDSTAILQALLLRFRELTSQLLAFANVAWPEPTEAASQSRQLLVGRFLTVLLQRQR